jgi:choline dehydrogenase-like flavoprotein
VIYVVGSGPAGVSCAKALLQEGARVTLLDVGLELEPDRSQRLGELKRTSPEDWTNQDIAFLKDGISADLGGIPLKFAYGSDFPYRDPGLDWDVELDRVETHASFAKGGLSTVWGAAVLPYLDDDIRDWPFDSSQLAPHYEAVLKFMPLSARHDSLEALFPLYTASPSRLELGTQAEALLGELDRATTALAGVGISFGASRLAVWGTSRDGAAGCRYCGLCMYGCPYGVIYCSDHTLAMLREHPNFTYWPGVAVDKLAENQRSVTMFARNVSTGQPLRIEASRVFLACGTLSTTKILLESLEAFDETVNLQDCMYFLLPLLRFRGQSGVFDERAHKLSQVFFEIRDREVCDRTVHLQVYGYNELYSTALEKLFGPAFPFLRRPARAMFERLLLIQGYLPSAHSPSIGLTLSRDRASSRNCLHLSQVSNARTSTVLRAVVRKLQNSYKHLKAVPLSPFLRTAKPGRSFHSGGTFPMRRSPTPLQTDIYGRPFGMSRVHAVDSTVFPSIPSTTITLSVMANAHRIGRGIKDY